MKTKELIAVRLEEVKNEIFSTEEKLVELTTLLNGCDDEEERYYLQKKIELKQRRLTNLTAKKSAMIDYIEGA
jgi:hypothetical protein